MIIGDKPLDYYTGKDLRYAVMCDSEEQSAAFRDMNQDSKVVFTANEDLALKINEVYHEEMSLRKDEFIENLYQLPEFVVTDRAKFRKYFELVFDKNSYLKQIYARYDRVVKDLYKYKEVLCQKV
jgi:hypothetical protein